jgi:hypothetical protein
MFSFPPPTMTKLLDQDPRCLAQAVVRPRHAGRHEGAAAIAPLRSAAA